MDSTIDGESDEDVEPSLGLLFSDDEDTEVEDNDEVVSDELSAFRQQWKSELQSTPITAAEYETARSAFMRGVECEQRGDMSTAVHHYHSAVRLVPDIEHRVYHHESTPTTSAVPTIETLEIDETDHTASLRASYPANGPFALPANKTDSELHLGNLPIDALLLILDYVAAPADLRSLDRVGEVCRGLYVLTRRPYVWRHLMGRLWMNRKEVIGAVEQRHSVDWRETVVTSPHIWTHGTYISKVTYVRHGEQGFQDEHYRPWHLVVYYRYLRFTDDRRCAMLVTSDPPASVVGNLRDVDLDTMRQTSMCAGSTLMLGCYFDSTDPDRKHISRHCTGHDTRVIVQINRQMTGEKDNNSVHAIDIDDDSSDDGGSSCAPSPPPTFASTMEHVKICRRDRARLTAAFEHNEITLLASNAPSSTYAHAFCVNAARHLQYVRIPRGTSAETCQSLHWTPLFADGVDLKPLPGTVGRHRFSFGASVDEDSDSASMVESILESPPAAIDKDDELRRERMRIASCAQGNISKYNAVTMSNQSDDFIQITYIIDGCMYQAIVDCSPTLPTPSLIAHYPLITPPSVNSVILYTLHPTLSNVLAFVHKGNVFVHTVDARDYRTLPDEMRRNVPKQGCVQITAFDGDTLCSAGAPPFVIQEEFDRFSGVWWAPSVHKFDGAAIVSLLYETVDENDVHVTSSEQMRYPLAGSTNAIQSLAIVQISLKHTPTITLHTRLASPLNRLLPSGASEYITRVGWTKVDGAEDRIWVQCISRRQRNSTLLTLCAKSFTDDISGGLEFLACEPSSMTPDECRNDVLRYAVCIYNEQTDAPFIYNVHDHTAIVDSELTPTGEIRHRFIWSSERSGNQHLSLMTVITPEDSLHSNYSSGRHQGWPLQARLVQEKSITHGDWTVDRNRAPFINQSTGHIYFAGRRDTCLESHIYRVNYESDHPSVDRVTELGQNHSSMSVESTEIGVADNGMLLAYSSSLTQPPLLRVYEWNDVIAPVVRPQYSITAKSTAIDATETDEYKWIKEYLTESPVTIIKSNGDFTNGHDVYSLVALPNVHDDRARGSIPVVHYVYAGPEIQLVRNSSIGLYDYHRLTRAGIAVVIIDVVGSANRAAAFQQAINEKMGTVEVQMQVSVLRDVLARTPLLDDKRICMHGWSYGGFMSLQAIADYGHVYSGVVAGAPVTDWRLYDTGYTERYMQLPEDNDGKTYANSGVIDKAANFPLEEGRLLLCHGLRDENVHIGNTMSLVEQLVKIGRPYDLQVYPVERHGLRQTPSVDHMNTRALCYMRRAMAEYPRMGLVQSTRSIVDKQNIK